MGSLDTRKSKPAPCHPSRVIWARGLCKSCYDGWLREVNPSYAHRQRQNCLNWCKENTERSRAIKARWQAKYDREHQKARSLRVYGLTPDDYTRMLKDQGGGCAICGRPPGLKKRLAVDHDHETGRVRGLLCFRCNWGLSYFSEKAERLAKAAAYLTRFLIDSAPAVS
jgi:hypothetical protein